MVLPMWTLILYFFPSTFQFYLLLVTASFFRYTPPWIILYTDSISISVLTTCTDRSLRLPPVHCKVSDCLQHLIIAINSGTEGLKKTSNSSFWIISAWLCLTAVNCSVSHGNLGNFCSSRFSTNSFTRVCLILKYLFLHNFSKTRHFMSCVITKNFTQGLTASLLSHLSVFPWILAYGLCLCIPIWGDFAVMIFLLCYFDPATLSFTSTNSPACFVPALSLLSPSPHKISVS